MRKLHNRSSRCRIKKNHRNGCCSSKIFANILEGYKKLKVLLLYSGKFPSFGAASKRISNYKKGLELYGHNVEIFSIQPFKGPPFIRILLVLLSPIRYVRRILNRLDRIDILFIYGFGWVTKVRIIKRAQKRGIKTVLEINEYPYSIVGSRRDKYLKYFNSINRLCLQRFVFPLADGFVVISEPLYQYVLKFKSSSSLIIKIPIIVDYDYYQVTTTQPECKRPYILHSSTINDNKDGIYEVLNAVAKVNLCLDTKVHIYFTSLQTLSEIWVQIMQLINEKNLTEYVHFIGDLDEQTLLAFQQHCSMVVINKVDSLQNRYNFATKLGEYLALGKPVITTLIGEVSAYLKNNVNCLELPPNESDIISAKIKLVLSNPVLAEGIAQNGKNIAKQRFDIRVTGDSLSEFFDVVIK